MVWIVSFELQVQDLIPESRSLSAEQKGEANNLEARVTVRQYVYMY